MAVEGRGIKSISVAGRILRVMVEHARPIMLSEIAERADINASQAHTYLTSFRRAGLVEQDTELGRYCLGPAALKLAVGYLRSTDWQRMAMQAVTDLSIEFGVMVTLVAWGTEGPTVIQLREGESNMNLNMRVGTVLSVTGTASGRIFASYGKADVIQARLQAEIARSQADLPGISAISEAQFMATTDQIRSVGLAWAAGSPIPNVNAVCAPIFGPDGEIFFSMSLVEYAEKLPVGLGSPAVKKLSEVTSAISTIACQKEAAIAS